MNDALRGFMEPHFRADFSKVRVHTDARAAQLSEGLNARAFTVGNHIYFGAGEYAPNTDQGKELIAHELTHVVQQGGGGATAGAQIQREEKKGWFESATDFAGEIGWGIVRDYAPDLEPVLKRGPEGVFDWLKDRAMGAAEGLFQKVTAPVRAIEGFGAKLSARFAPMVTAVQTASAQIARNDCTPLRDAAEKIEKTAAALIQPVVEFLQPVVKKIQDFMSAVWDKIGAPLWEAIKDYAAEQWRQLMWLWDGVKTIAKWIWGKTATFRAMAEKAWVWFKNKLGIGEGPEGEDGLLQWVQRKVEAAWAWVKAKIEPYKNELIAIGTSVGAVALAMSPAGPILLIGGAVYGAVQALRWVHANWGKGNIIVTARVYVEKTLIPGLLASTNKLGASLTKFANSISGSLGALAAGLTRSVGTLAASVLRFAVNAVQWIADQAQALAAWATDKLNSLSTWVSNAVLKLQGFMKKVLTLLQRLGDVLIDIWALPKRRAAGVWNPIPACIRDPIVDFVGPIILRQIEIFQELAKNDEAWQQTKADVYQIIHLVFVNRDLKGAIKATFYLVLRVFNLPPDLLRIVANKALAAWDTISKAPIAFLKNTVRSLGVGFKRLWNNIGEHLEFGLQEWLLGPLKDKGVAPPSSWTDPKAVFGFVLDVLGLSVSHIWELLAKRFNPTKVAAVRSFFGAISKAWDWINKAIDTSKTPEENTKGIIEKAKEFGKTVLTGVVEWIAGKVATELAIMAAAAAASAGLSEVVDIVRRIYKALVTAVKWARRILDMINETLGSVLQIASGQVDAVGEKFEKILHRGMPVVIGFLADQVGLGDLGTKLRSLVEQLRAKVDEAILWLIDKIKAGLEALISGVKTAGGKRVNSGDARDKVTMAEGEEHDVYFKGDEETAELIIESTPRPLADYLSDYVRNEKPDDAEKAVIQQIRDQVSFIQKTKGKKGDFGAERGLQIQQAFDKIVVLLGRLKGKAAPLKSEIDWPAQKSGDGRTMVAKVLSLNPGGNAGSTPSDESALWKQVRRRVWKGGNTPIYVRGHLLNHHLHGGGFAKNLTPLIGKANTQMESRIESALKNAILGEKRVFRFEVNVIYSQPAGEMMQWDDGTYPEMKVANRVEWKAIELGSNGKKDLKGATPLVDSVDNVLPKVSETKLVKP